MIETLIVALFTALLAWLSIRANARFRGTERLPMQWWFTGEVTWTAPRVVALTFTPVLAILVLSAVAVAAATLEPRRGQEGMELPVLVGMGTSFLAFHLLHLWLMGLTLRKRR